MGRALDLTLDFVKMCNNSEGIPLQECEREEEEELEEDEETEGYEEEIVDTLETSLERTFFVFNIKVAFF